MELRVRRVLRGGGEGRRGAEASPQPVAAAQALQGGMRYSLQAQGWPGETPPALVQKLPPPDSAAAHLRFGGVAGRQSRWPRVPARSNWWRWLGISVYGQARCLVR